MKCYFTLDLFSQDIFRKHLALSYLSLLLAALDTRSEQGGLRDWQL